MAVVAGGLRAGLVRLVAEFTSDGGGAGLSAYGGIYVAVALGWLWLVDGVRPSGWDVLGVAVILLGAAIIMCAPRVS
ncbi:hypothetical protein [Dyella silvatica]|uniref:hypothetical protein n=1 Tax=Dyella silvatica TaxID=2992128 RepID=UPI002257714F|nr:hypothetical protein [Dyella silvatica]